MKASRWNTESGSNGKSNVIYSIEVLPEDTKTIYFLSMKIFKSKRYSNK